ncbi:hypothetical protein CHARACLAT_027772 [Characodon lateralis]|uniref:Secreted protein n=1 Tax=Characodon lateralis TaxID=208331 RepID=A0ABU7DUS2_9TELE|nr:hypothetical protein [Characodon lateralis]
MNLLHTPILFLVLFRKGSWMNRLHTPILFLVLFWRGPKPSHPNTLFLSVRGFWMDCLHSIPCSCSRSCPGGLRGQIAFIPGSRFGGVCGGPVSTSCSYP